jgi:hypothetical protein
MMATPMALAVRRELAVRQELAVRREQAGSVAWLGPAVINARQHLH